MKNILVGLAVMAFGAWTLWGIATWYCLLFIDTAPVVGWLAWVALAPLMLIAGAFVLFGILAAAYGIGAEIRGTAER